MARVIRERTEHGSNQNTYTGIPRYPEAGRACETSPTAKWPEAEQHLLSVYMGTFLSVPRPPAPQKTLSQAFPIAWNVSC